MISHPNKVFFIRVLGSSVIRMMANFLGKETFKRGVSNYLKANKFSNARQDDLWKALTKEAHEDGVLRKNTSVKEIMDTWTLQMGFPVVQVQRKYNGESNLETTTFQQQRFLLYEDDNATFTESKKGIKYKWWIPISYTTPNGNFSHTVPQFWLQPTDTAGTIEQKIEISNDEALILNVQETGFYRVNYDERNWKLLEQALKSNYASIHRVNRAQILSDAFSLAQAGLLNYSTALSLTKYLQQEDDYIPWKAVLHELGYLDDMLGRTGAYGDYKKYIIGELNSTYNRLGFISREEDNYLDFLLREKVIKCMCKLGYDPCVKEGKLNLNNPKEFSRLEKDKCKLPHETVRCLLCLMFLSLKLCLSLKPGWIVTYLTKRII